MEDSQIVALYWARNEDALAETAAKYGRYCFQIAYNILSSREDADESVNDTYMSAWERIPPHEPAVLSAFLGKITRRISLNRWRNKSRKKRGGGEVILALEELRECIPSSEDVERRMEQRELSRAITQFLAGLAETERNVFVCRYWYLADIKKISKAFGFTESKVKSMLHRTRIRLKAYLTQEGLL